MNDHIVDRPESLLNLQGATRYVDDLPVPEGTLHAVPVGTKSCRGRGLAVDAAAAQALHPSVRVLTAADIPGENQLGYLLSDEPLLAEGDWDYSGQAAALVLAVDRATARAAADRVVLGGEELPGNFDPREAHARGDLIMDPVHLESGDLAAAFAAAAWVASGSCESGGQEHLYLECQSALAYPEEGGRMRVISSTQSPSGTQKAVARILGVPMAQVEVEAGRLGGAFGGKEDQASPWAAMAALGASLSDLPVKLVLSRADDLRMTGKRHPYSSDFRLALGKDGRILGLELTYYQNSGASLDLSLAIIWRSLFHAAGAYRIDALRVTGYLCRTNLPPFTAFRGFGAPQAFFVMESALVAASELSGIPVHELQRINLLSEGDVTHYGMRLKDVRARRTWEGLVASADFPRLRREIDAFNGESRTVKRGAALQPVCFGISFTKLMMNQGGALVHVYADGSVSVATGAVEMGQGVARKILVAAARTLGIGEDRVRIDRTRTSTVANTVPTAASTGADINAMAALLACREIKGRLLDFAARSGAAEGVAREDLDIQEGELRAGDRKLGLPWKSLLTAALEARIDLSAHGYYASPGLHFDQNLGRGDPFVYHVYGTALVTAEVDLLRARCRILGAKLLHDGGVPIDEKVDRGQIEGAFAQGLGWALLEDLRFGADGRLLTDSLSTYKVPDLRFMDFPLGVDFLKDALNPKAVLGSKAVGEPPFIYGIAGYFAVLDALRSARRAAGAYGAASAPPFFDLPLTAEKALAYLEGRMPC